MLWLVVNCYSYEPRWGMFNHFYSRQCSRFVCVHTWLWSGHVFVLIHPGHREALFNVDILWNYLCSTGGHQSCTVSAKQVWTSRIACSSSPGSTSLLLPIIACAEPTGSFSAAGFTVLQPISWTGKEVNPSDSFILLCLSAFLCMDKYITIPHLSNLCPQFKWTPEIN